MVTVQTSVFTFAPVKSSLQALALKGFDLLTLMLTGTRMSSLQNQKGNLQTELKHLDHKSMMNNIALKERQEELLFYENKAIFLAEIKKQNEAIEEGIEECKQICKKAVSDLQNFYSLFKW